MSATDALNVFGKNLRRWRRSRDWTQAQLSKRLGITPQSVVNLEIGKHLPSSALAARLREVVEGAFDIPVAKFGRRRPGRATDPPLDVVRRLEQVEAICVSLAERLFSLKQAVVQPASIVRPVPALKPRPLSRPEIKETLAQRLERIADHGPAQDDPLDQSLLQAACAAAVKRVQCGTASMPGENTDFWTVLSNLILSSTKAPAPPGTTIPVATKDKSVA